jgi:hypothetical protein
MNFSNYLADPIPSLGEPSPTQGGGIPSSTTPPRDAFGVSSLGSESKPSTSHDNSFMNKVFGPLGKDYCLWFYFLSIIGFVLMIFILVSGVIVGIWKKSKPEYYLFLVSGSVLYLIIYFQNRLLHTMCVASTV